MGAAERGHIARQMDGAEPVIDKALQPMTEIKVVAPTTLEVRWSPNARFRVDLSSVAAASKPLAPLLEPAFFARAKLSDDGFAVEWSDAVDLSGAQLWRWAQEQAGADMPAADFRAWMTKNHLSQAAAARALGLSRRLLDQYASGERPVPLTVKLATVGWEAGRRGAA